MPELIQIATHRDNFVMWWLINAITHVPMEALHARDDGNLEVSLLVNGHECPVRPVLEEIERQMEQMIQETANELLKEKLDKTVDEAFDIVTSMKEGMREKLHAAGFTLRKTEDMY